jgi:hypothetical protein
VVVGAEVVGDVVVGVVVVGAVVVGVVVVGAVVVSDAVNNFVVFNFSVELIAGVVCNSIVAVDNFQVVRDGVALVVEVLSGEQVLQHSCCICSLALGWSQ